MVSLVPHSETGDAAAVEVIRAGYDNGIRIFDTARAYARVGEPFHNEALMRSALAGLDGRLDRDERRPLAGRRVQLPR